MGTVNLMAASNQWACRPADERFWTIDEMYRDAVERRVASRESADHLGGVRAEVFDGEVVLRSRASLLAVTNYSFGQVCRSVGAPQGYVSGLSPTLAAQNLNYGLSRYDGDESRLLVREGAGLPSRLLAVTSLGYARVWNSEVIARLKPLIGDGWRVPPARPAGINTPGARPATKDDLIGDDDFSLSVREGDMIAPAGLYNGDRDMFAFMVKPGAFDDGAGNPVSRGFFCWNSEVGDRSFGVTEFAYEHVCGNHIVWGASDVVSTRVRHVGEARQRMVEILDRMLLTGSSYDRGEMERRIRIARSLSLGKDRAAVIQRGATVTGLSRKLVGLGFDAAEETRAIHRANPATAWGLLQGLTRVSQNTGHQGKRDEIDRRAAKLTALVR